MKPLVPGSPMEASAVITKAVANSGAARPMPPKSSMRRVWRRSYIMPSSRNSAPVEMPWLIMTTMPPCRPFSVRAKIPMTTNPMCATDV